MQTRQRGRVWRATALGLLLAAAGCAAPAAAPVTGGSAAPKVGAVAAHDGIPAARGTTAPAEMFDVTIGSAAATLNVVAVDVAVERGFFAEEGVRVRHAVMKSDATIAGLVTGEVQFTGATGSLARAIPMGMPAKVVMFMVKAPNSSMYAQPDVQRVEDLLGPPFGVNALVSDVRVIADY